MSEQEAKKSLRYAVEHLQRVQSAWTEPTDWTDLSIYGFYCLEAAVKAAALYYNISVPTNHRRKAQIAEQLAQQYSLPNISDLLIELNTARKASAYGDVDFPEGLNPENISTEIKEYVTAVSQLIEGR